MARPDDATVQSQAGGAGAPRVAGARLGEPDSDDLARLDADARLPAELWLQRIRAHRERGELDLARASLARFTHAHPSVPVPADLVPLLP